MNAEKKRQAEGIVKIFKSLSSTIEILEADCKKADELYHTNIDEQFNRRTLIRTICAWAEGTLAVVKSGMPQISEFFGNALSKDETEIVRELRVKNDHGTIKETRKWLKFRDNVKLTFPLFAKIHGVSITLETGGNDFKALCATIELRHRLMHPKQVFDLQVSDDAMKEALLGMWWYHAVLEDLMEVCGAAVNRRFYELAT